MSNNLLVAFASKKITLQNLRPPLLMFTKSQLFDTYGPLGIFLNTPSHHRVHHGRNPYCIDRNYAAVFIIWDKMFGTFEPERKDERPVYGIINREMTFDQIWLQVTKFDC